MASSYIKICLTSLIINKMEIKTTEYHHITFRLVISKKIRNNKFWQGYGVKEILVHCCLNIIGSVSMETVWRFFKRFKIEQPLDHQCKWDCTVCVSPFDLFHPNISEDPGNTCNMLRSTTFKRIHPCRWWILKVIIRCRIMGLSWI